MIKINKKLQALCNEWEYDMKGDMLEGIENDVEIYGSVKNSFKYLVDECFPLWIKEADSDNKQIYIEYQMKFKNILKLL